MNNDKLGDTKPIVPSRGKLRIEPGQSVLHGDSPYVIKDLLSTSSVVVKSLETGKVKSLQINELRFIDDQSIASSAKRDLHSLHSKEYKRAEQRFAVIEPLLELDHITKKDIEARAVETNTSVPSIYRWLKKFNSIGVISGLMMKQRGWPSEKSRLTPAVKEIIEDTIQKVYLSKRRPSVMHVIREVEIQCGKLNLPCPHPNSIRNRINQIDDRVSSRRRGNRDESRNIYDPAAGQFPGADYPLAVIQIDHTPVDVIVVDDVHRQPIGRPFLTLAIDVFSRCVTGYYLGMEAPNENSVAMCIAHSVLPKEAWLELHDVQSTWDVRGFPAKIHVDNGADFRTETLRRACREYNIQLEYRPVKQPQYGGHIERLLGTFMRRLHDVPGTTFSSVKDRGNYDSDKMSVLTMEELERWLLKLITQVYHGVKNNGIGLPPRKKWELGLWGDGINKGSGLPEIPTDPLTLQLDFMPLIERTIQKDGVEIDGIQYYSEALRPYIGMKEQGSKRGQRFVFRRDPRNISKIWFFDSQLGQYFEIPYADQSMPTMSIWELRNIKNLLKTQSRDASNHHEIRQAHAEMKELLENAEKKTKRARKQAQQARTFGKTRTPAEVYSGISSTLGAGANKVDNDIDDNLPEDDEMFDDLTPFDEM